MSDECENCERLRRYSYAQARLIQRLHTRAQMAEGALLKYIAGVQKTGGIHHSLYRPGYEGQWIDRLADERERMKP